LPIGEKSIGISTIAIALFSMYFWGRSIRFAEYWVGLKSAGAI
jgi:hypothetical protein